MSGDVGVATRGRNVATGRAFSRSARATDHGYTLGDGARVAVMGGGPAGSMFAYFLLDMAGRVDLQLQVDIYEPRVFGELGPAGCNMCGGIISERLVQNLAADGVILPSDVVQRGIDSYVLHTDVGSVQIATPQEEMRIAAVHRGAGPRNAAVRKWKSFDQHLLDNAVARGARVIRSRVQEVGQSDGRPTLKVGSAEPAPYELLAVATGVNTSILKAFEGMGLGYRRPRLTKTLIREYYLGDRAVSSSLGASMHVFLLNIPHLEFAALIPKGDYVTMCLLGEAMDNRLGDAFTAAPEVRGVMPPGWDARAVSCQCLPHINVQGVDKPYADRIVFIGDCGVTRLYKDGIGAAYRTAKAAARTAVFEGVSERAWRTQFLPICRAIRSDNRAGRLAFTLTRFAQRLRIVRQLIVTIARDEQRTGRRPRLSNVLWDLFSGSAPYTDIFRRLVHPAILLRGVAVLPRLLTREGAVDGCCRTRAVLRRRRDHRPPGPLLAYRMIGASARRCGDLTNEVVALRSRREKRVGDEPPKRGGVTRAHAQGNRPLETRVARVRDVDQASGSGGSV